MKAGEREVKLKLYIWEEAKTAQLGQGQLKTRGSIPGTERRFSLLQNVQTGGGTQLAPYVKGTEGPLP
jgi:hypothetical protein